MLTPSHFTTPSSRLPVHDSQFTVSDRIPSALTMKRSSSSSSRDDRIDRPFTDERFRTSLEETEAIAQAWAADETACRAEITPWTELTTVVDDRESVYEEVIDDQNQKRSSFRESVAQVSPYRSSIQTQLQFRLWNWDIWSERGRRLIALSGLTFRLVARAAIQCLQFCCIDVPKSIAVTLWKSLVVQPIRSVRSSFDRRRTPRR